MVNVYIVRTGTSWVLIDAGLRGYSESIAAAARAFTGSSAPPSAIVLTHGHFDHVGSLGELLGTGTCPSTRIGSNVRTSTASRRILLPIRSWAEAPWP